MSFYRILFITYLFTKMTETTSTYTEHLNLQYGPDSLGERNQLDLFTPSFPSVTTPPYPVVLFIHGGQWRRGDKSQIFQYNRVKALTSAGFALASINWEYSSSAKWPAQLEDVVKALDFLSDTENSLKYQIDCSRLVLFGQSSGAHLALMGGLKVEQLTKKKLKVSGVVSWFAPSELWKLPEDKAAANLPDRKNGPTPEEMLVGCERKEENRQKFQEASPAYLINTSLAETDLPFKNILLAHGDADVHVPMAQTERLKEVLESHGGLQHLQVRFVSGGEHGGDKFGAETTPAVEFIAKVFNCSPSKLIPNGLYSC
eukprot:augustus_masked-scaffold_13-processed-gene-3.7-mRNA-1 protein AED:1.00 eAED:1.00 QI:0/-1/0/0/-1/1/1/0/314